MSKNHIRLGIAFSDRVIPFLDGSVQPRSLELEIESGTADEIFLRALHANVFDLAEMSLAAYCVLTSRDDRRFVGLPIFTSRAFRHNCVYVRSDSDLTSLAQLSGRRVGLPEYQMTAAVWIRGVMADDYGVDLKSIEWYAGGVDLPRRQERIPLRMPPAYRLTRLSPQQTLGSMLLTGEIDALIAPKAPDVFRETDSRIRRLIVDYRERETRYFEKNGIFPIMHLLVMRRETHEAKPRISADIYEAFMAAKEVSMTRLRDTEAPVYMAPWIADEIERTYRVMGDDYWPYGVRANERCLATFLRFIREQELLERPLTIAELFVPELRLT
jgi:4,5-dihydroxyphthalate decarboxylase